MSDKRMTPAEMVDEIEHLKCREAMLLKLVTFAVAKFTDPDIVTKDPAANTLKEAAFLLGVSWPWAEQFPDLAPKKEVTP